jgi:hypothetical protein
LSNIFLVKFFCYGKKCPSNSWRRSQEVKAVVCKTIIHRFDSDRRLQQFQRDYRLP